MSRHFPIVTFLENPVIIRTLNHLRTKQFPLQRSHMFFQLPKAVIFKKRFHLTGVLMLLPLLTVEGLSNETVEHWAYSALESVSPPAVKDSVWLENPIDAFIFKSIEDKLLPPAPILTLRRGVRFLNPTVRAYRLGFSHAYRSMSLAFSSLRLSPQKPRQPINASATC